MCAVRDEIKLTSAPKKDGGQADVPGSTIQPFSGLLLLQVIDEMMSLPEREAHL